MNVAASVRHHVESATLGEAALIASGLGAIATIPGLPTAVRSLALAAFVLVGPGAAAMCWIRDTDRITLLAAVPLIGLSVILLASTASAWSGLWHPTGLTLLLAALTAGAAEGQLLHDRRNRTSA